MGLSDPGNGGRLHGAGGPIAMGSNMNSAMHDDDAVLLSAIAGAEYVGNGLSAAELADVMGEPVEQITRSMARLRARGCLTKQGHVDWRGMTQADLLALGRAEHRMAVQPLAVFISRWMDAHPGRFDGFTGEVHFDPDGGGWVQ